MLHEVSHFPSSGNNKKLLTWKVLLNSKISFLHENGFNVKSYKDNNMEWKMNNEKIANVG